MLEEYSDVGSRAPCIGRMNIISHKELAKHNGDGDVWMAIHGVVYDVSNFMNEHPGGWKLGLRSSRFGLVLLRMPWGGHGRFCEHSTQHVLTLRMTFQGSQLLEDVAGRDASLEFEARMLS